MSAVKNAAGSASQGSPASPRSSARERLLDAADELFYSEGVHRVGIDRVIEHAGVAKASLYNTFGSKEALVSAYLERRHTRLADRISAYIERYDDPRDRLLGVFESQASTFGLPSYRGCAFVAASAEAHAGDQVVQVADENRAWVRTLFVDLVAQAGVADAAGLGRRMHLLYDGAAVSARMDHDPSAGAAARETAAILLDAALAAQEAPASA